MQHHSYVAAADLPHKSSRVDPPAPIYPVFVRHQARLPTWPARPRGTARTPFRHTSSVAEKPAHPPTHPTIPPIWLSALPNPADLQSSSRSGHPQRDPVHSPSRATGPESFCRVSGSPPELDHAPLWPALTPSFTRPGRDFQVP